MTPRLYVKNDDSSVMQINYKNGNGSLNDFKRGPNLICF